jgi:hypothetical protein
MFHLVPLRSLIEPICDRIGRSSTVNVAAGTLLHEKPRRLVFSETRRARKEPGPLCPGPLLLRVHQVTKR